MAQVEVHEAQGTEPQARRAEPPAADVVGRCPDKTPQAPAPPDDSRLFELTAAQAAADAAEVLSQGGAELNVSELAARALDAACQGIEQVVARTPSELQPACRAGCAFCCAIPVAVSAPEALYIAAYLQETLSAEAQIELRTHLSARAEERQGRTVDAGRTNQRFCCFLCEDRQCSIYPIRPLACRGYNSLSRSACEEAFTGQDDRVHMHEGVREVAAGVIYGLILASKKLGLEWGRYELETAVLRALDTPDAAQRWARGERVFAGCDQTAGRPTSPRDSRH